MAQYVPSLLIHLYKLQSNEKFHGCWHQCANIPRRKRLKFFATSLNAHLFPQAYLITCKSAYASIYICVQANRNANRERGSSRCCPHTTELLKYMLIIAKAQRNLFTFACVHHARAISRGHTIIYIQSECRSLTTDVEKRRRSTVTRYAANSLTDNRTRPASQ